MSKSKTQGFVLLTAVMLTALFTILFSSSAVFAGGGPPESVCFDVVAGLGGTPGTWSATGFINSSGTATFDPFVAGWDSKLGIPATVHDTFVLTDSNGTITMKANGHSALVPDDSGNQVPGFISNWVIIDGTDAYANLHGQGDGTGYPDFATGTFPVHQCGRAH